MRYILSPISEQDIGEIVTFMAKENASTAHHFVDALYGAFDKLSDFPKIGHLRLDITDRPVRFWPFKWHYLIIYKDTQPLEIVRVLSGYRDIANIL